MKLLTGYEIRKERCKRITAYLNTWLLFPHLVTAKQLAYYRYFYIE